jgi:hypothetical protein
LRFEDLIALEDQLANDVVATRVAWINVGWTRIVNAGNAWGTAESTLLALNPITGFCD